MAINPNVKKTIDDLAAKNRRWKKESPQYWFANDAKAGMAEAVYSNFPKIADDPKQREEYLKYINKVVAKIERGSGGATPKRSGISSVGKVNTSKGGTGKSGG